MTKPSQRLARWIVALLLALGTLAANAAAAVDEADKVKLIEDEAAGWSRNMDQLLAVFSDDVTYEDATLGVVFHSKEELRGFAQGFFNAFPDLKAVITSTVVSGNRAASEWRFVGTQVGDMPGMPASNKLMDLHGVSIYEFEGGKIKHKTDYWDLATMLKQLGFMPVKQ